MSVMSITITRLRKVVHQAAEQERLREQVSAGIAREMLRESLMFAASAPMPEGWPCIRCGCLVPEGEDRTRHYVPGH